MSFNVDSFEAYLSQTEEAQIVFQNLPPCSYGRKILNWITGRSLVADKVYDLIKDKLKNYNINDYALEITIAHILDENNCKQKDLKTVAVARRVFDSINDGIIEGIVDQPPLFDLNLLFNGSAEADATNLLRLFMGANLSFKVSTLQLTKALFWSKNQEITLYFRRAIQTVFDKCFIEMNKLDETQQVFIEGFVGNLLALIPYTDPEKGEKIIVPQKINGVWEKIEYRCDPIKLTPDWLGTPFHALGLIPSKEHAKPLLVYSPTLYPALSGSLLSAISTSIPGHTVGEMIYRYFGKKQIEQWLLKHESVKAFGLSLGGAMTLLSICDFPNKFAEAFVYGSPAPLERHLTRYDNQVKSIKPNVHVFCNHGDYVLKVGTRYHDDWHLHTLIHPEAQTGLDQLFVHGTNNNAVKGAIKLRKSARVDAQSSSRIWINIIHQVSSALILPVTITILALSILKSSIGLLFKKKLGET